MPVKTTMLYQVHGPKKKTIYDAIEEYVGEKYDIRYNQVSQDLQISLKGESEWEEFEVNSFLIELAQSNIEVTPAKLDIFLKSHFVPRFNPIEEYFINLPKWDGEDHIGKLISYCP